MKKKISKIMGIASAFALLALVMAFLVAIPVSADGSIDEGAVVAADQDVVVASASGLSPPGGIWAAGTIILITLAIGLITLARRHHRLGPLQDPRRGRTDTAAAFQSPAGGSSVRRAGGTSSLLSTLGHLSMRGAEKTQS
jgi:hypothetical protein